MIGSAQVAIGGRMQGEGFGKVRGPLWLRQEFQGETAIRLIWLGRSAVLLRRRAPLCNPASWNYESPALTAELWARQRGMHFTRTPPPRKLIRGTSSPQPVAIHAREPMITVLATPLRWSLRSCPRVVCERGQESAAGGGAEVRHAEGGPAPPRERGAEQGSDGTGDSHLVLVPKPEASKRRRRRIPVGSRLVQGVRRNSGQGAAASRFILSLRAAEMFSPMVGVRHTADLRTHPASAGDTVRICCDERPCRR